jgi:hypothetical protein
MEEQRLEHVTKPVKSTSFFVKESKTHDDRLVLHGRTAAGNKWRIKIVHRTSRETIGGFLATVTVGSRTFENRVIRCDPLRGKEHTDESASLGC